MRQRDIAHEQMDAGVALPHRFHSRQLLQRAQRDFRQAHLCIQAQGRLQLRSADRALGQVVEALAESSQILRAHGKSGRHGMAAVADQQIVTFPQRGGQIESFNAAARSAPFVSFAAQDDGGTIKLPQHARGDNADHSDVPEKLAFHDDKVGFRIEFGPHGAQHLVRNASLDGLPLAVAGIQFLSHRFGLGQIGGEEQLQRNDGVFHAARPH